MTPTAEDLAFALAALDAGCWVERADKDWFDARQVGPYGVRWSSRDSSPLTALTAAGRALGLQPKWVVVPVEDVLEAAKAATSLAYTRTLSKGSADDLFALADRLSVLANALSSTPLIIEGQDADEFVKTLATPPLEQRNPKLTQEARRVFRTHGLPSARDDGGDTT